MFICAWLGQSALSAEVKTAFSFEEPTAAKEWFSVNDGVMGGISKGNFKVTKENTLLFNGELSLENNGGFASIRSKDVKIDLAGASGIIVNARGDGRTYWVGLREAKQRGASSFRAYLPTVKGELKSIRIPLADFKYQTFGRSLPLRPLNPLAVSSIGFTIADKKAGNFQLEIESIEIAYSDDALAQPATSGTIADVASQAGNFKTLLAAAQQAGLVDALNSEGPLTFFAPTDEAFAALPEGTISTLLKPENKQQLANILKYHVIAGRVSLADALKAGQAPTLEGNTLKVAFQNGSVRVGEAKLVTADITASNGVIHVIDQVLLPPPPANPPLSSVALIHLAIERGVAQFNSGNPAACADIYEITVQALRTDSRLSEKTRDELTAEMKKAGASNSESDKAWILRYALDRALQSIHASM
ncbi:MAG: CIA30 family protein [Opitutales bacterium]|nr:CIA30 family protein [Opitutales bacterium]MDP4882865.1 CIA30 family protein [Opitutales bacterium]MDP4995087.1 CIA30 family protein [Akkermansiaceae bacterium]